jgi:hypothetical protein
MVPVSQCDDGASIIDIVPAEMGVDRICKELHMALYCSRISLP